MGRVGYHGKGWVPWGGLDAMVRVGCHGEGWMPW